jgi:hypothetical protein
MDGRYNMYRRDKKWTQTLVERPEERDAYESIILKLKVNLSVAPSYEHCYELQVL